MLRRRSARAMVALTVGIVAALAPAAPPAVAQTELAPPYKLVEDPAGSGNLVATPVELFSTIAVTVRGNGTSVVFTPAAASAPGCLATGTAATPTTTCPAALMAQSLTVAASVVQVDIGGVATALMTINGGANTDAITVQGPSTGTIGLLRVRTGPGGDDLTVGGNVTRIEDSSDLTTGAPPVTVADNSPDRYTITAPVTSGVLQPGGNDDIVTTTAASLTLDGGDGNDTLSGPGPLIGGAGDDLLRPTTSTASVRGDAGIDRVSYERLASPAGLALALTGNGGMTVDGAGQITTVEEVEGGPGNDTIVGDGAENTLAGGAGDDTIDGRGAVDRLDGGVGGDTVSYATEGAGVVVSLGAGSGGPAGAVDMLLSFEGVAGGAGNDLVNGTAAPESFSLGPGDDQLNAGEGNDAADGGEGNDQLRGGAGRDTLGGGPGKDAVTYDERTSGEPVTVTLGAPGTGGVPGEDDLLVAIEDVVATPGPDILTGDDGPNALFAGAGRDTLSGMGGDDAIFGADSRDLIDGGTGRDQLFGEGGDDSLAAFDNEADLVDCGASLDDDAQVDPNDTVAGCEYSRRLDIPIPVDADQDGTVAAFDCNDANPAINPAAPDVPADGIDQNCDGFDEQLAFVEADVSFLTRPTSKGRRIRSLSVTNLQQGSRLTATCTAPKARRGAGRTRRPVKSPCAFKTKTKTARLSTKPVAFTTDFRNRILPAGTQVQIRITTDGRVGKVWIYRINARTSPRETRRCLTKGNSAKPQVCPPEEA